MLLRLSSLFIPPIVKRINEIDAYRIQSRKQSSNPLESTRSLYTTPFIGNIHSSWRGFFPLEFQIYCRVSLAPLAAVGAGKKPRSLRRLALYRAQSLRFSRRSDSIIHLTEMSSGNYRINRVIKRCFRCSRGGPLFAGDRREIAEEPEGCPETRKEGVPVGPDLPLLAIDENVVEIAVDHRNEAVHDLERAIQVII